MSDYGGSGDGQDQYEYDWPSDQEEEVNDNMIEIKNTFYTADENRKTNPKDAIEQYETVV